MQKVNGKKYKTNIMYMNYEKLRDLDSFKGDDWKNTIFRIRMYIYPNDGHQIRLLIL